jgi:hypothetical protein
MYNYTFNITNNKLLKKEHNIESFTNNIESFSDGTQNINIRKSFDSNTKVDNSKLIDSINKIVSNVSNNVVQENVASSNISSGSSNRMILKDIGGCKDIIVSGVRQTASSTSSNITQSKQKSVNSIATNITNDIYNC